MQAAFNHKRLRQIGFALKCCELCAHSRFYEDKSPWGLCAKHAGDEEQLRIHKLGRCRRGFRPHEPTIRKRGLGALRDFAEASR